jgi:hypothetical protein
MTGMLEHVIDRLPVGFAELEVDAKVEGDGHLAPCSLFHYHPWVRSVADAVDGSSTGTQVPRTWLLLR